MNLDNVVKKGIREVIRTDIEDMAEKRKVNFSKVIKNPTIRFSESKKENNSSENFKKEVKSSSNSSSNVPIKNNSLNKVQEKLRITEMIKKVKNESSEQSVVEAAVMNVVNAFLGGTTIIVAAVSLGIIVLIVAIVAIILGAGLLIAGTSYNCEDEDLNDAYIYTTKLAMELEEEMIDLADNYRVSILTKNGARVSRINVEFDSEEILPFLAAKYDDYKFNDIKNDIKDIFEETHSYTKRVVRVVRRNSEGEITSSYRKLYLDYTEEGFEEYVLANDLLEEDELELYNAFMEQTGTYSRQSLGNPFSDVDWKTIISSPFGYRIMDDDVEFHEGLDLAMTSGTPIKAIMSGKITRRNDENGYGLYVTIKSGKKETLYGHLSSYSTEFRNGDEVQKGDIIGYVGSTGRSTGPHLHLGYKIDGTWYNPAFYIIE